MGTKTDKTLVYDSMVEALPAGFMVVDRKGSIIEFNRAAEEITGYNSDEVMGRTHMELLHGTRDPDACPLARTPPGRDGQAASFETTIRRKSGESVTVAVTAFPVHDPEGRPLGGVEIFSDVSGARQIERERKNLISMFVHDMKNPVTTSGGFVRRMAEEKAGPLTEKQKEYLGRIANELDKVKALIEDFLDYARFESDVYEPDLVDVDVGSLLRNGVEAMRLAAEEGDVGIECSCPEDLPVVRADELMVDRVITNLLDNAVKYTGAGGTVKARCAAVYRHVLVEVSNPMGGMDEDELPFIFDAFRRAHAGVKGSGLGLAVSKKIVEVHGGRIWARTGEDGKLTISFTLPLPPRPGE